jgi:hypothetical protein
MAFSARANRAFLGRAVRYLAAEAGMRQFLDIGTGIPTAGNTHQVAQAIAPESRVVYVDYDRCKSGCVHARVRPVSRRNRLVIGWTVTGVTRRSGFPWRKAVLAPGMPMATAGEAGWLTAAPCRQRPGATVT